MLHREGQMWPKNDLVGPKSLFYFLVKQTFGASNWSSLAFLELVLNIICKIHCLKLTSKVVLLSLLGLEYEFCLFSQFGTYSA